MGHIYTSKFPDNTGTIHWSEEEDQTWSRLLHRQKTTIIDRSCPEFKHGLELIGFSANNIPRLSEINMRLSHFTGWKIEAVPAIISDMDFHTLLSQRRFPAASFIRIPEEFDYLEQPDIFHEFFGHIPLLMDKNYADFLERFGKCMISLGPELRKRLGRVFWFTIEFGLIETSRGIRIYGSGILSSHSETVRALEDISVERIPFDLLECARTPYCYDTMQSKYFIIKDFNALFSILDVGIIETLEKSITLGDIV